MAVNQSHVDGIISSASGDDPAVKLENLEREVDLIKASIKRLLMDMRERMNDLGNPFTLVSSGDQGEIDPAAMDNRAALEAREAALDARESTLDVREFQEKTEPLKKADPAIIEPVFSPKVDTPHPPKKEFSEPGIGSSAPCLTPLKNSPETLPLQKAYHLFRWIQFGVKKFGHDRLEQLVESYCVMGYITKTTAEEIQHISRLMPENLGNVNEIGPDEFVYELYTLNRLLSPNDNSLDRDMIEVLMEQRREKSSPAMASEYGDGMPGTAPEREKAGSPAFGKKDLEWMNLRA
ncbi:hypothetical protein [Methanoregula sp.]|uniref:hypothetical protein n=1 Tax=Methanoregula sp. TaxID=2052170 RepID=UPI0035622620